MKRNLKILILLIFTLFLACKESEKIEKLIKEAENGNAISQYTLGGIYYFGEETTQNFEKAFHWLKKSADQNIPEAQYFLGIMYRDGEGTSLNNEKSFYWFKKSAELKDEESQYELAGIYDLGIGTIKDRKNSIYWYNKSANQGNQEAKEYLNYMHDLIGKEDLPNDRETFKNCEILAKKENSKSQLYLGLMYFYGNGIKADKNKAGYWISKSLANGNIKAKETWEELKLWLYYDGR